MAEMYRLDFTTHSSKSMCEGTAPLSFDAQPSGSPSMHPAGRRRRFRRDRGLFAPAQRQALIEAGEAPIGIFLRATELTGARPIEMANAKVSDFDGEKLRLAHRKGKPPKLRLRHVVLGEDGIAFFTTQCKGRLQNAWICTEDGERQWRRHMWARKVRTSIGAHNAEAAKQNPPKEPLPQEASAYSFRPARISELLQIHGVDPLTVAAQTGTSLGMIERAYLRFIPSAMREKLAAIKEVLEDSRPSP